MLPWILQTNQPSISDQRRTLFQLLNGDVFYPVQVWPKKILSTFWKKPIGDKDTFQLMLFFLGNGCSPDIITEWIYSSQHWASPQKLDKRKRQVSFICNNMDSKGHIWFYFDIHHNEWLYLNGQKRTKNQNDSS